MNHPTFAVWLVVVILISLIVLTSSSVGASQPSVEFNDQTAEESIKVAAANLPDGGYIVIYSAMYGVPDEILGHTPYISPGQLEDIEIVLETSLEQPQTLFAVIHRDTNGDEMFGFNRAGNGDDSPYTLDDQSVRDSANISIPNEIVLTPTPRTVTLEVPSPSPAVTEVTEVVERARVVEKTRTVVREETVIRERSDGQPGFGIGAAILALLATALLGFRRHD